jgi:tetratricopeptide (TPR) repeat protein
VTRDSDAVLMRAAALLENGDARSALTTLECLPDEDRFKDSRYWVLTALVRHALGQNREAIAAANWALSIEPHEARLYAIRFAAERDAGLVPEAERSILAAIRLEPTDATYQVAYAWLLASAGHLEKARRVNAAARQNAPDNLEAAWQSAELARLQGKDAEALAAGRQLLASSGPDSVKRALLGWLLIRLERDSEAAVHLKEAGDFAKAVGIDSRDVAVATHWLMRPYRLIERVGLVATPALLIALAILLLAANLVTAALAVAAVVWIGFLFSFTAAPLARLLRRAFARRRRSDSHGHRSEADTSR